MLPALDIRGQIARRPIAAFGLFPHGHGHDAIELDVDGVGVAANPGEAGCTGDVARSRSRCLVLLATRRFPAQQFEQQQTQRMHVSRHGDRTSGNLFGRGVGRGVDTRRGHPVGVLGVEQFGDAEVEQNGAVIASHQQVGRLQIAMHDEVGVRVVNRPRQRHDQVQALLQAGLSLLEPARQ